LVAVRDVERMVQEAVLAGAPIGSSDKGYFWCLSREDFDRARAYLVCRMKPQAARAKALGRAMRDRFPDEPLLTEVTERRSDEVTEYGRNAMTETGAVGTLEPDDRAKEIQDRKDRLITIVGLLREAMRHLQGAQSLRPDKQVASAIDHLGEAERDAGVEILSLAGNVESGE
jgi:hypothetical protein